MKLILRQKNAIGYNIHRVIDRAQKSCPFGESSKRQADLVYFVRLYLLIFSVRGV